MASGNKTMQINTQERAISPDINRLQTFKAFDVAEMMRYLLDVSDTDAAPGAITEYTTLETPLRAEIFNGLMVAPQAASTSVFVTPGAMYALAPDGAAEDSNYKFVKSTGVTTLGTLVIAANASGSPRIDVVECQWTTSVVETDSRDIFDETTGLFSAALVPKVSQGILNFRVTAGTPGAGYPPASSGWLPLAVALVPNGSTNNDTVTFWDVRPLLTDRVQIQNRSRILPEYVDPLAFLDTVHFVGEARLSGRCEVRYGNQVYGGTYTSGTTESTGTEQYIDLRETLNQSAGFAFPAAGMVYGYWCQPFGLPRWVKYASSPAARLPGHARGIFVLSTLAPNSRGVASADITMPTASGFIGQSCTAANAVLAIAVRTAGSVPVAGLQNGAVYNTTTPAVAPTATAGANNITSATYTLTPGTHFPASAKAIYLKLVANVPIGGAGSTVSGTMYLLSVFGAVLCELPMDGVLVGPELINILTPVEVVFNVTRAMIRIPCPTNFPDTALPPVFGLRWDYSFSPGGVTNPVTSSFTIVGWEL